MPAPIQLRRDFTAQQLRDLASALEDESHARRLRAIAAILEGASRSSAARLGGMERQTLRDWVHRFNMWGPDGLKSMRSPGRPPKLTDQQRDHLAKLIENSALSQPWRLADVVRLVRDAFEVELDEVTVGRLMKSLGYTYSGTRWRKDGSADDDDEEPARRSQRQLIWFFKRCRLQHRNRQPARLCRDLRTLKLRDASGTLKFKQPGWAMGMRGHDTLSRASS